MSLLPRRVACHQRDRLVGGWEILSTPAGSLSDPSQLADAAAGPWLAADTLAPVAAVLRERKLWSLDHAPRRFDAEDWWYRLQFDTPALDEGDELVLGFDGLATIADVWLNGELLLHSDNMFVAHEHAVRSRLRSGGNELTLRFHSVDAFLLARRPRPRWRAPMVEHQQLRWLRTTLLGRTPGWSPPAAVVGPWKDVWLERRAIVALDALTLHAAVDGDSGVVSVAATLRVLGAQRIDGATLELTRDGAVHRKPLMAQADSVFDGALDVPQAALWWPHTHGEPALYEARLLVQIRGRAETIPIELGGIGFRTIELDRNDGRFALRINGVPVFCRGACWTPLDVVSLRGSAAQYEAAVAQVRDAGMNMLRVSGAMVYEDSAFHDACDRLGVLVWQEFMFANMDYPADDERFVTSVREEVTQQLRRWQGRPSLAVLCGNSEVAQQAAMWGAARDRWDPPLFHSVIAGWVEAAQPGVPYWPSSAHGGAFPFQADEGTTSYYGVGAYLRPLADARRADLKFATECLAFSNVPDDSTIARMPGGSSLRVHQPAWKSRSPRDLGAGWDFDDVRDHYLALLYRVDPVALRHADHERYLALSRVVTGEVMAATFAEWRRSGSQCGGALVWLLRDLWPGAGWGLIDDAGMPKACFFHLARALQPVAVSITDEGGNGLAMHILNEGAHAVGAVLRIDAFNDEGASIAHASRDMPLAARSRQRLAMAECFDGFIDFSAAYRFGPPPAVVVATLQDGDAATLAQAFHFPAGLPCERGADLGLQATAVGRDGDGVLLTLRTEGFAQSVHIELDGHAAEDNDFHLSPGSVRTVRLRRVGKTRGTSGTVQALNTRRAIRFDIAS